MLNCGLCDVPIPMTTSAISRPSLFRSHTLRRTSRSNFYREQIGGVKLAAKTATLVRIARRNAELLLRKAS
jgi:hypothetical protein